MLAESPEQEATSSNPVPCLNPIHVGLHEPLSENQAESGELGEGPEVRRSWEWHSYLHYGFYSVTIGDSIPECYGQWRLG
jgi:hypothetical protein